MGVFLSWHLIASDDESRVKILYRNMYYVIIAIVSRSTLTGYGSASKDTILGTKNIWKYSHVKEMLEKNTWIPIKNVHMKVEWILFSKL